MSPIYLTLYKGKHVSSLELWLLQNIFEVIINKQLLRNKNLVIIEQSFYPRLSYDLNTTKRKLMVHLILLASSTIPEIQTDETLKNTRFQCILVETKNNSIKCDIFSLLRLK